MTSDCWSHAAAVPCVWPPCSRPAGSGSRRWSGLAVGRSLGVTRSTPLESPLRRVGMSAGDVVGRIGPSSDVPIVHAVTNDEVVSRPDFIDVACAVMRALGNRGALHLRAHRLNGARFQALAEGLAAAQGLTGGWLVVNDRVDIALLSGARAAQLTSNSLAAGDARRTGPPLPIGASVHDGNDGRSAEAARAERARACHGVSPPP